MTLETQLILVASVFGLASLSISILTFKKYREQQFELELGVEQIENLEDTLAATKEALAKSSQTVSDHARRLAWLDAKIRQSRFVSVQNTRPAQTAAKQKTNIKEQRSRVLKLAGLGQDPNSIAAALGMMPGEVELILSLNSHYHPTA